MSNAKDDELEELATRQTTLLLSAAKSQPIVEVDLIVDRKAICQLSTLYTSTRWCTARILSLRHVDPQAAKTSTSLAHHQQKRWTLDPALSEASPYLPLSPDTAVDFDSLTNQFSELSSLIQRTLHLEIRLQLLHGISRALGTTYFLSQPYNDPDPSILALNKTILSLDEDLSSRLPSAQYKQITAHLSSLADDALVSYAATVPAMDAHGHARMQLNILVLQQNLKEMSAGQASLAQAAQFWGLWEQGLEAVVGAVKEGLPKEQGKDMVRLCYSVAVEKGGSRRGPKSLDEVLVEIERA